MGRPPLDRVCSVNGCDQKHAGRGYCDRHYGQAKRLNFPDNFQGIPGSEAKGLKTQRFIEAALVSLSDDCILWTGGIGKQGYPVIHAARKVHRIVCQRAHGEPPSDRNNALHRCGNKRCLNPRHLYWGTRKENSADARRLGEMPIGERSPAAKLTEAEVLVIRDAPGTFRAIGEKFGVSHTTVEGIKKRVIWRHL